MEVCRSNYLEVLPEIIEKLEKADFISFDAEYTGLKGLAGETTSLFDNTSQRYAILRRVVQNNSAPQFGISIFNRIEDGNQHLYRMNSYCFYLTEPSFADFNMTDPKAKVEIDCVQFLTSINFNFEKWIFNSVPYLNKPKLKELEKYLDENPDFMAKCKENGSLLDPAFFPEYSPMLTATQKREIINNLRGFSTIVDVISKRKMPVVGHNVVLDLMYFYRQFCSELPESYEEFRTEVLKVFPTIYDTKFMTIRSRRMLDHPSLQHIKDDIEKLKCSGLFIIYRAISANEDKFSPKIELAENCIHFQRDLEMGKTIDLEDSEISSCHDPSFDASVTGIVFLHLAHLSNKMSRDFLNLDRAPATKDILFCVRHWENQLFVSRATIMTMCLRGNDPRPSRSWVKVTSADAMDCENIMKTLKSNPKLKRQINGVDYQQVSPTELILAVARAQSATDLCTELTEMGYEAKKVLIPWDKKRYENTDWSIRDHIYDTRRNAFLCFN